MSVNSLHSTHQWTMKLHGVTYGYFNCTFSSDWKKNGGWFNTKKFISVAVWIFSVHTCMWSNIMQDCVQEYQFGKFLPAHYSGKKESLGSSLFANVYSYKKIIVISTSQFEFQVCEHTLWTVNLVDSLWRLRKHIPPFFSSTSQLSADCTRKFQHPICIDYMHVSSCYK